LKRLNDQLYAPIMTLQNTRRSLPSSEKPTDTKTTSGKQFQSQRRHRATSPTPSELSDEKSSSSHPRMKDRHDHSRRKTEEFIRIQDLDKFVQKQVKGARMPYYGRLRAIASDAFSSPFSKGIPEYKFPKKFIDLSLLLHSEQSDTTPSLVL